MKRRMVSLLRYGLLAVLFFVIDTEGGRGVA